MVTKSVISYSRDNYGYICSRQHLYFFNHTNMLIEVRSISEDNRLNYLMLSPDNYIQAPDFSQSFNRYSYCLNNPINLIDKSGYYWLDYDYDYDWEDPPDPTYWGGWKTGIEVIASFDDNYTTREIDYDWNDFYEDYLYEYASGQGGDQISMDASHNRIGFVPLDVGENYGAYQMANYRSNISVRGNQSQITVRATSSNTPVAGGQVVFRARASLVANGNTTYAQVIENGLAVFKLPPSQNVSLTVNGGWTVYYDYGGAAIPVFHPIFWPFSLNFTDNFKLK